MGGAGCVVEGVVGLACGRTQAGRCAPLAPSCAGGTGGNFQAAPQNNDIPAVEEIPTIDVNDQGGDDDIKIEDIPF